MGRKRILASVERRWTLAVKGMRALGDFGSGCIENIVDSHFGSVDKQKLRAEESALERFIPEVSEHLKGLVAWSR